MNPAYNDRANILSTLLRINFMAVSFKAHVSLYITLGTVSLYSGRNFV